MEVWLQEKDFFLFLYIKFSGACENILSKYSQILSTQSLIALNVILLTYF